MLHKTPYPNCSETSGPTDKAFMTESCRCADCKATDYKAVSFFVSLCSQTYTSFSHSAFRLRTFVIMDSPTSFAPGCQQTDLTSDTPSLEPLYFSPSDRHRPRKNVRERTFIAILLHSKGKKVWDTYTRTLIT